MSRIRLSKTRADELDRTIHILYEILCTYELTGVEDFDADELDEAISIATIIIGGFRDVLQEVWYD